MACVTKVEQVFKLGDGSQMAIGSFKLDSTYPADGETFNIANTFPTATYPAVICDGGAGYIVKHNQGTAAAGKIIAYQNVFNADLNTAMNTPLYQCHTGLDLSTLNCRFVAFGKAY